MLRPSFPEFVSLAREGDLIPVVHEFLFDADTAVTAYAKLARPPAGAKDDARFGFLLESLVGGEKWARWTFLGTSPASAWRLEAGRRVSVWEPGRGWSAADVVDDPVGRLDALIRAQRPVALPGLPRFIGGAVGYLGYDVVRTLERLPAAPPDDRGRPEALLVFTDVVLAIDNLFGRAHAIACVETRDAADEAELRRRYDAAVAKLDTVLHALADRPAPRPLALKEGASPGFESTTSRAGFERDVERIRAYIRAGDAYQVVLSQRLTVPLRSDPFDLYRALRSLNPSPYLYFLELDGLAIVGSSPEAMVRLEDGRVTVRPIAGTRPRGRTDAEDELLSAELLADEKERAEHLMLVDLGRNDVGRIARYGTVRVPEFMSVEKYSHVLHMVSQVEGELRHGLSAADVFRACFPAGTVSGAPKIRAMEIIDELEPVRRGCYAGAVGYFAWGGQAMDTAIAIRTIIAEGGRADVQAGAGIVADSIPAREYDETLAKARALLAVLGMVQ
ncbi:MAG: anthranilate synthase component I [Gemmatimonadetes bacterium]|nr:anthranilate synthase component I [Gemmatimonadota bacterium]